MNHYFDNYSFTKKYLYYICSFKKNNYHEQGTIKRNNVGSKRCF